MISKYSKGAIALHWLIAILVIANFVLASMAEDLPREAQGALMSPHKAIGISILFFSVLRLIWRLTNKPPHCRQPFPLGRRRWDASYTCFSIS
ncbi:cytochrome b [Methylocucumis oryzae]|uniref:cytochrome b n=1 Tax=Methylocucumis oryzae TaxID=1632867 RepID=UPI0006985521|nr:cytochrome b/b6 domain-containing protein [Methylocucumis oryzae]